MSTKPITYRETDMADDDAKVERWNDGALDALRGAIQKTNDADYLAGYAHGLTERRVRVVIPAKPEGYYHAPLGTFDQ